MKFHFISSIFFAVCISLLVLNPDPNKRMLYLVPTLILFYATFMLFSLEYDRERMKAWRKKEKSLIEDTYSKFVSESYKNSKNA